jgi:hypothetical protein
MYMDEKLLEEFFLSRHWPPDEKLRQQLVQNSDEAVPLLLRAIDEKDKVDGADAIGLLGLIGYPGNELAIPTLVEYLGADINDPRYQVTVEVVFQMGPDVVVPHLIRALLDKGEPSHVGIGVYKTFWVQTVEGICWTISTGRIKDRIDQEYALRCCPAVNALLLQADPALDDEFSISTLLDVIERAGETVDYVIPALIELIKRYPTNKIRKRAEQLLTTFKPEALKAYSLLLNPSQ